MTLSKEMFLRLVIKILVNLAKHNKDMAAGRNQRPFYKDRQSRL